ncbi:hypothetical protein B566_EDAN009743 [Ephemera danica]|nr:hypothetical protein B566_EDAN009743 [Ephemera danica]
MWEWAYIGVNGSIPGNGGPQCAAYLYPRTCLVETVYTSLLAAMLIAWGYRRLNLLAPPYYTSLVPSHPVYPASLMLARKGLLLLYCLIWAVEIGFKFASQTVVYLLNPCHVVTVMQIYLLAAPPSHRVSSVFRLHLNYLNGAILAFVFPVTESRTLPFETVTYWLQHSMMLVVPAFLLKMGGVYTTEAMGDLSWNAFAYGFILLYHFIVLQIAATPVQVNLNHMLCPMPDDPFASQWYRSFAVMHQALLCPLSSKLFCFLQTNYFMMQHQVKSNSKSHFYVIFSCYIISK